MIDEMIKKTYNFSWKTFRKSYDLHAGWIGKAVLKTIQHLCVLEKNFVVRKLNMVFRQRAEMNRILQPGILKGN